MPITQDDLRKCVEEGMTMIGAAKHLNVSKSSIQRSCRKWGVSFDRIGKVSQEYLEKVVTPERIYDCLDRKLTLEEAAADFKIHRTTFARRLSKLGISFRKVKFDPVEYALLKKQGLLDTEIREVFGMSSSGLNNAKNIHNIKKEKRNFENISEEDIKKMYLVDKLPIQDISEKTNKSVTNIYEILKSYKILLRRQDGINISKDDLLKDYIADKMSLDLLALKYRTTTDAVKLSIIRHNLDTDNLYALQGASLNHFNSLQEQLIYGSLLGDGCLETSHVNASFNVAHCLAQKDYVLYKYQILRNFVSECGISEGARLDERTLKEYYHCIFDTVQRRVFTDILPLFYHFDEDKKKIKYINDEVLNKLDERGLSFWFMDDGWKSGNQLGISTECFTDPDLNKIVSYFKNKWDIQAVIDTGRRIVFKKINAFLFQSLISPHIIPLFSYKLLPLSHQKIIKEKEYKEDYRTLPFNPDNLKVSDFDFNHESFSKEINDFIKKYEWLGSVGTQVKWCFTYRYKEKLAGVVLINEPNSFSKLLKEGDPQNYEALIQRGCSASWTPKNMGSSLIMLSLRWMAHYTSKKVFVGYSDPKASEVGTIYQACNFDYLGNNFGTKHLYIHPTIKDGSYFSKQTLYRTSTLKKWCQYEGILFEKEWLKENGFKDLTKIPTKIKEDWHDWIKKIIRESILIKIPLKGKYCLVLGKNKTDQKILNKLKNYEPKEYPKRDT